MARAKRSDIEARIAALQAELDDADTDDEIWVKDEAGREFKVTGKRATGILGKLGLLDGDAKADEDQADEDDEDDDPDPEPKGSGGYFRGRRK